MIKITDSIISLVALVALVLLVPYNQFADADEGAEQASVAPQPNFDYSYQLTQLRNRVWREASFRPHLFDINELNSFMQNEDYALRILIQRSGDWRRAAKLASSALRWRHRMGLSHVQASDFPCDLFTLGLIFEFGTSHHKQIDGQYDQGNPVIWIRLGALGSVAKLMARSVSSGYNRSRDFLSAVGRKVSRSSHRRSLRERLTRQPLQGPAFGAGTSRPVRNHSVGKNPTMQHVLRSIAWWLDDWSTNHPGVSATLVMDFENTDFAFASWSMGDFFIKLDDYYPGLFNQIIGFRYKPKLYSLQSPISMFNRIFKSRVSSSPETDRKLKFVSKEEQISVYMPRVDSQGFSMLPEHVSGNCMAPDDSKAPANCLKDAQSSPKGLYDPNFWQMIYNEFYYACQPKLRQ